MKQAIKEANDILRMKEVIKNTESKYLIRDYRKAIAVKDKELKEYCRYRNINYEELFRKAGDQHGYY